MRNFIWTSCHPRLSAFFACYASMPLSHQQWLDSRAWHSTAVNKKAAEGVNWRKKVQSRIWPFSGGVGWSKMNGISLRLRKHNKSNEVAFSRLCLTGCLRFTQPINMIKVLTLPDFKQHLLLESDQIFTCQTNACKCPPSTHSNHQHIQTLTYSFDG